MNQPLPSTIPPAMPPAPKKSRLWLIILIVAIIAVVVIIVLVLWWQNSTKNALEQEMNRLRNEIAVTPTISETPIASLTPTPTPTPTPTLTVTPTPTAVDNRILLTPETILRYCDIGNPATLNRCGNEQFNYDPPTTTVTYTNAAKGIKFEVPYNPKWGNDTFRINPYDEAPDGVYFGPIGQGEGGGWGRMNETLIFEPAQSADRTIAELNSKEGEFFTNKPYQATVDGKTVVKYSISTLGDFFGMVVIGPKYNYHFTYWGDATNPNKYFGELENIVRTVEFI